MNVLYYLMNEFFKDEKMNIIALLVLSLGITIVQTNAISFITANIIQSAENNQIKKIWKFFGYFMWISALFFFVYYIFKVVQNNILTKFIQWLKHQIFRIILLANNESMNHVNFIEFITPITRIATSCYALFFDLVTVIIPMIAFLVIISMYFCYKNATLGSLFIIANICIVLYFAYFWKDLAKSKNDHEVKSNENEKFIIDILNNIDKVIYRGQTKNEIDQFSKMTDDGIKVGLTFLSFTTFHMMVMTAFVYVILFSSIWYLIQLKLKKKIDSTTFITFFTILLLYRDKILNAIQNMPDYLEFIGRLDYILDEFNTMLGKKQNIHEIISKTYSPIAVEFKKIQFKNVSFTYNDKQAMPIFDNLTVEVDSYNKIIGMTGLSGKGKSSFAKLLLRLYEPTGGSIYIDGVDVTTIDPNYIRENITYVNQNSRLFDKKIIDNMVYGCNSPEACQNHLQEIMRYPTIKQLYQNVDVLNGKAGSLGENLSGGQRQVVNIISGLINPSKILILDEPTNALDPALKTEVIALINHFRQYKQCIIIITHDKDVHSLFDETLRL